MYIFPPAITDLYHNLFILCVLSQRFQIAMEMWKLSSYKIATALLGKKLVDCMIAQIEDTKDTSELQEISK